MPEFSEHASLFTLQNEVLVRLQSIADPQLSLAKLCGKTFGATTVRTEPTQGHDHAKWLTQSEKIKRRETTTHNRRKSCLYPAR